MGDFELLDLLHSAGTRMKQDLNERLTSHPGELGRNREEVIRQFLRYYLPRRFEISHGFAFDSAGGISKELDLIVADAHPRPDSKPPGAFDFFRVNRLSRWGRSGPHCRVESSLRRCSLTWSLPSPSTAQPAGELLIQFHANR